ncbi:hypothetical protein P6709_06705 [Jeotgalibacillus sp. ET6]|uniref:hypothetical protein n=1 Tax=Jeotgalibacillus sp. ET6 TaxID=3037260 RepID=UPI0024186D50|nr:hypothetical protein [Jeotgalibacillus sp. ET6]MDG5471431.1 hypothetical protein [Jeotgalibacillus sp. ET6]
MEYSALIKRLDPLIEEEVTIEMNGIEFTGFAFICAYKIEVGECYSVSLGFTILDEFKIRKIQEEKKEIERIGLGYEYYIRGFLNKYTVDAGIVFNDENEYFSEYPELINNQVEIIVDRISIEFLK